MAVCTRAGRLKVHVLRAVVTVDRQEDNTVADQIQMFTYNANTIIGGLVHTLPLHGYTNCIYIQVNVLGWSCRTKKNGPILTIVQERRQNCCTIYMFR